MATPPETLDLETDKSTVYYDMNTGEFVVFDTDGDDLILYSYFDGEKVNSFRIDEFVGEGWSRDFLEVEETVVESPEEVVTMILSRVMNDEPPLGGLNRRDARFAIQATEVSRSADAAF